ncbi:MAG TPA: NAD+ synthase [Bacillota bacterium]|nr:NAD+ synthase [Bacillota bacterium]
MKVTIAQLNPTVGDIPGNLAKLAKVLEQSSPNSDLIIFPELYLVGYPPKDLLEKTWFIEKVAVAVQEICAISLRFPQTGILLGAPISTGEKSGKGLYNSALLIYQGQILHNQPKSLLPTYDVFDEARHFTQAPRIKTVTFKGANLGISICEDAWNIPDFWPITHSIYALDPINELVNQGATLLVNISASPFYIRKDDLRYRLIRTHSQNHGLPFIFVNQVGGNDELIFDGGSMVFNRQGELLNQPAFFTEHIQTIDLETSQAPVAYNPLDKTAAVHDALVLGIKDYLHKCGFQKAVIGLSGGIDSALTCCLAAAALGKENVLGISMPSPFSSQGSVEDSRQVAENLGIDFKVIPITKIYEAYLESLAGPFSGLGLDVAEENIQARIRGNILMAFSNKFGYLALSTGNKSELAVGYCTLYGDMSGGLSAISDVPKTMVYELARYVNRKIEIIPEAIMVKAPSAELRPDQKDQDTLPPYPILDQLVQYYIEDGYSAAEMIALNYDPETVNWVIKTVDRNEYKRKQAAPGLKVTSKAFGVGRRMPVAKKI